MKLTVHKESSVEPKFLLGSIVATPHALEHLTRNEITKALSRHAVGDWGDVHEEDSGANDLALLTGERLLSVYTSSSGRKFWLITEADRSSTTVLLPEDY
jgi:hypothetical protein